MSNSERQPEDRPEKPELGAILPDTPPPSPSEVFANLDDYQRQIEKDWESAKRNYKSRVSDIMDEFMKAAPTPAPKEEPADETPEQRLERLLKRVEKSLAAGEPKPRLSWNWGMGDPSVITVSRTPWRVKIRNSVKIILLLALLGFGGFAAYVGLFSVAHTTPVPYAHPASVFFKGETILIADWFRKTLYVHADKKGLPILSVENLPNNFITGFAMSDSKIWTIDGLNQTIFEHALSIDHRVTKKSATPGKKPAGLYWDGTHLWSADIDTKKLYQHHANDLESILNEYDLPDVKITAFHLKENRLWLLDGEAREITVYRLQKTPKLMAAFDLDGALKGAVPTGLQVENKKVWILTENPPQMIRLSRRALEKLKPVSY